MNNGKEYEISKMLKNTRKEEIEKFFEEISKSQIKTENYIQNELQNDIHTIKKQINEILELYKKINKFRKIREIYYQNL